MSGVPGLVADIAVGTRLAYDGDVFTVAGVEAQRLRLRSRRGGMLVVHTATLLADASTRILGAGGEPAAAVGPVLDSLSEAQRAVFSQRLAHVRELLTGYASGHAGAAAAGEPRAVYHPGLPLKDRYAAKAAELGVTVRTVERWVAALRSSGPAGLLDGRNLRAADPVAGVDERWLAMCRVVLDEHTDASRPTRDLVLARISARLDAQYGPGVVAVPGRRRARVVLAELTRASNALVGSTAGKRSIAAATCD